MPKIADLRKQFKSLAGLSDYEVVDQYAQQNGVSFETIANTLGVAMPNTPGFGTSVKNSMFGLAQGIGQLGADFVPGVESNNALESYGRAGTQRNPLDIMDGEGGAFSNLAGNLMSRPLNTVGQIAGQAVGLALPGGALKLGTTAYRGLRGMQALGATGRAAQAGGEAALYGTSSYGSMRDQQEAQGDNTTNDKLKALFAAGAMGSVERFAGLEGLIAGRSGAASTLGKTMLRQGLGEAGEEIIQTPIEKFGANQEVVNMDTLDQAAAGGLAGFVGGSMAGPLAYQFGKKKELLGNANTEQEDAVEQKVLGLPNRPNENMIAFPDGSAGTQAQADAYINGLPEAQRVNARARLSGLNDSVLATNVAAEETPAMIAAPSWNFIDPDTQTLLPEPKDVVGKGTKKVQAYSLVAQARNDGLLSQDEFLNSTNEIAATNKIGKILPKITASLEALKLGATNGNVQNLQETELQVQGLQGSTEQESPNALQEETGQIDLAAIATKLAPQQRQVFDVLVAATQNNEIDQIISGDGKLQYTAIGERAGLKKGAAQAAINQTVKKISKLAGIDVKQYLADRTNQVRQTEPATETQLGLSPRMQDSLVDESAIFGDEDSTASMGMAKSLGATDTDQSSVMTNNTRAQDEVMKQGTAELVKGGALDARGGVITPEGDVTPSENAQTAADESRKAFYTDMLTHPLASQAESEYNDFKPDNFPEFEALSLKDKADWIAPFIEVMEEAENSEWDSYQIAKQIENEIRVFARDKEQEYGKQNNTDVERVEGSDAGTTRSITQEQSEVGTVTREVGSSNETNWRNLPAESRLENANIAIAEVLDTGLASKGKPLSYSEMREGAVGEGFDAFYAQGLGPVLLDMAEITVGPLKSDGLFIPRKDKSFVINLRDTLIAKNNPDHIAHVVRHELSHALDHKFNWAFSDNQKMQVVFDGNKITYIGAVAREIEAIRTLNKDGKMSALGEYFRYPLELKDYTAEDLETLDEFTIQAELFAQMQAAWMSKDGQQAIRVFLPKTAQYLTEVNQYATRNIQTNVGRESSSTSKAVGGQPGNGVVGNQETRKDQLSEKGLASKGFALNSNGNDYVARAQSTGTDAWKKLGHAMKNVAPKLLTSTQLVEQYGNKIPALKTYIKAQNEMGAMASQLREASSKLLEVWGTYSFRNKAQNAILMGVMHDATQAGIHPDVAFNDETNNHLTDKDLALYNQLASKYNALPDAAKKLYQDSKQLLSSNWDLRQEIYADVVGAAYNPRIEEALKSSDAKKAALLSRTRDSDIKEHAKQIKELKGPYFPLLRFGDYVVIAESDALVAARREMESATPERYKELAKTAAELEKDGKHYVVEAYESRLDMEKRKEALSSNGFQTYERKAEAYSQEARPVTAAALEKINDSLTSGFDKATANKLKDLVTEMYVAALPEHHALQRQIKRKGVTGADANMMRAFAETVERDSFYLSRMKYAQDLSKGLVDMRRETRRMSVDEQNVYNNVVDRATADYQYEHTPVLSALARLSSIFHLGISPAFLLTNMTQPWFISVPQLAGAHGATKTFSAMRTSWLDATKIIKQGKGGTVFNLADVDLSAVTNLDERKMLERLRDVNKLDSTQLLDMGALSNGMTPIEMKGWKVFNWATHHIELTNRISTALATYRLERARNPSATQETLTEKSINMVDLTQLDYSNENAAYFMKPGVGLGKLNKIIFQFRKYQQGMIYLLGRNAKLAFAGDKAAMKALGYLMGTQLLMAGTTGLPITAPLLFLAYGLAGDDDDEEGDLETQIRNYAADVLGPDAARVFWKGLPTALGADLSGNIGMGGLFKPFPMMAASDITQAKTGEDAIKELLFNAAGAPVGMVAKMAEGAISFGNGEYARGISQMTPRFVSSLVKAGDLADNGVNTRSGTQVMTADQFDGWDITLKAAGFNPVELTEHYTAQSSKENTSRAIQDRRNLLLKKYAVAKIKGDDVSSIKFDIQEFNLEHPKVKLDQSSLIKAIQSRKKGTSEVDQAGVRFRRNEESLKGIDRFAY